LNAGKLPFHQPLNGWQQSTQGWTINEQRMNGRCYQTLPIPFNKATRLEQR
jgi:hypothetical protein